MRIPLRSLPSPSALARTAASVILSALVAGCMNVTPPGTTFASEPTGARVEVDGQDSGWVTPCQIALDLEREHVVRLLLDGYVAREVVLVPEERNKIIDWRHGVSGMRSTIHFPTRLPVTDLFFPFRENDALSPGRVFVRLRPESGS